MWVSEYWCLSLIITVYSHQTLTIISSLFASDHSNMLILSVFLLHPSAPINVAAYGMNLKLKTHIGAVGSLAILQLKVLSIFPNILKIKFWVSMPTPQPLTQTQTPIAIVLTPPMLMSPTIMLS